MRNTTSILQHVMRTRSKTMCSSCMLWWMWIWLDCLCMPRTRKTVAIYWIMTYFNRVVMLMLTAVLAQTFVCCLVLPGTMSKAPFIIPPLDTIFHTLIFHGEAIVQ